MQLNKIMYTDLAIPLSKSYAPEKGEEMNRSTYNALQIIIIITVIIIIIMTTKKQKFKDLPHMLCFMRSYVMPQLSSWCN